MFYSARVEALNILVLNFVIMNYFNMLFPCSLSFLYLIDNLDDFEQSSTCSLHDKRKVNNSQ